MTRLTDFLSELKHRRVYRVAVVYAGIAFIISEIVANTIGYLNLPDSFGTAVIVILIIGFPIVIGLAWAFDITDEGIVRAKGRPAGAKRKAQPLLGNKSLAVIAVLAIAFGVWALLREPSPGSAAIRSIAVLPLDNQMGDPGQDIFVEGMHDAIITNLNRLSALKVISRTSTMRYKDTDKLLPEIAQELGVDALVEGSVFRTGNQVRITAQLIHGTSDEHLWANEYEGVLEEILSLQRTIAQAIANEIGLALTPEEKTYLASAPQVNPKAYELYLLGWQQRLMQTFESIPKAVEYLEQAVELDPDYARAWAALAVSYGHTVWYSGWDGDSTFPMMNQALDRALTLDPNDELALVWQAVMHYHFARLNPAILTTTEAFFRRALDLNPNNMDARYEYGTFLRRIGRPSEALAEHQLIRERDPTNPLILNVLGLVYSDTRKYEEALDYFQVGLELTPGSEPMLHRLTRAEFERLMQQGDYAEAAAFAEQWYMETPNDNRFIFFWLEAEWAAGNQERVHTIRDSLQRTGELEEQEQENPVWAARLYIVMGERDMALNLLEAIQESNPYSAARYFSVLGERGKALDLLERYGENSGYGWSQVEILIYDKDFDPLRNESRFKALLRNIGAQEVFDQYGNFIQPLDETLEAYNAPGSK